MKLTELNIINGLKNGDDLTYIHVFREYYVPLCAYALRYVDRKEVAEEIVSEVFFKILENRETLKINTTIKGYLFKAVCNSSINYLHKRKKEKSLENTFDEDLFKNSLFFSTADEVSERSILMEDIGDKIEEAILQLPKQQQKAFRLKRFEGKKNKEVAEIMGISIKTVEMHLSKAMITLREKLEKYLPAFLLFILLK